jgi:hypothetical protein
LTPWNLEPLEPPAFAPSATRRPSGARRVVPTPVLHCFARNDHLLNHNVGDESRRRTSPNSEVCSHSRQCSCTTQRSSPRRRSAGTRPRRLLSSTVRRAPQPAAPRTPCTPADEPRLRAVVFCGIGGAAAGARSAGLDVALGVDIHAQRLGVFKLNFPEAESVCGQLAVPNSVFTEVRGRERACPVFERENFHRIRYRFVDETPLHTLTDLTRDPTSHESTSSLGRLVSYSDLTRNFPTFPYSSPGREYETSRRWLFGAEQPRSRPNRGACTRCARRRGASAR